jgi:hypothetical protein
MELPATPTQNTGCLQREGRKERHSATKARCYLLAAAANRHQQGAAHVQHLARGLQLGAGDFNAFGQKCEDERGAAGQLQRAVAPCQPELTAGTPVAILRGHDSQHSCGAA